MSDSEAVRKARALQEADVLALTVWAESSGEPWDGQAAVAWVIENRARRRQSTIVDICLAPAQFSCWTSAGGEANYQRLLACLARVQAGTARDLPSYAVARFLSGGVLRGELPDVTRGSDHYLSAELFHGRACPKWATTMAFTIAIGNHVFLRS